MPSVRIGIAERDALTREAARAYPYETGGVLMGYQGENDTVVITTIIGPGLNARHAHQAFVPDHEYHANEVAKIYSASGGRWTYLGDWHSHPGGSAHLSWRDRSTLRRIARSSDARVPHPLMLVVCGQSESWQITAHRLLSTWQLRTERIELLPTAS
jgi:integrative and conjugative element protein (TIGR02256 family)